MSEMTEKRKGWHAYGEYDGSTYLRLDDGEHYDSQSLDPDSLCERLDAALALEARAALLPQVIEALRHDCGYYVGMEADVEALMQVPEFRARHRAAQNALAWMAEHHAHKVILAAYDALPKATNG